VKKQSIKFENLNIYFVNSVPVVLKQDFPHNFLKNLNLYQDELYFIPKEVKKNI